MNLFIHFTVFSASLSICLFFHKRLNISWLKALASKLQLYTYINTGKCVSLITILQLKKLGLINAKAHTCGAMQCGAIVSDPYVPVKSKRQHAPPPSPEHPRAFEFLGKFLFKFPPPRAKKLIKWKLPDNCFNFSDILTDHKPYFT